MKKLKLFLLIMLVLLIPNNVHAINEVNIYFFHSNSCDFCKQEKVYLDALKQRYPNMRIYAYEISDKENNELMKQAKEMYNIKEEGVPFTVIADSAYVGFSQSKKAIFQKRVYEYSKNKYENKLGTKLGINYRNDLEGTVEEYKDNSSYQIEETSGIERVPTPIKGSYDKYKVSFYLVLAGVILSFIAFILNRLEKKGRI